VSKSQAFNYFYGERLTSRIGEAELRQIGCQSPEEEVQMSTQEPSGPGSSEYHQQPRMILQDMLTPKPSQSGIYVFFMTMPKKKKLFQIFYKQKILIKKI
jgi:hypothetical protein